MLPVSFFVKTVQQSTFLNTLVFYVLINFLNPKFYFLFFKPEFFFLLRNIKQTSIVRKVAKNYRKIVRKIRQRKNLFTMNRSTGKIKLKFGNFFYLNQKKNFKNLSNFPVNKKPVGSNTRWISHSFFLSYRHFFNRRWFFLTGLSVSPMSIGLREKKRWLLKKLKFKLRRNYKYWRTYRTNLFKTRARTIGKFGRVTSARLEKDQLKKIYYDNMFYFLRAKVPYRRLKFFMKLIHIRFPPHLRRNVHHKSYSFLHNAETYFKKTRFPLKRVFQLFKLHRKLFRILKRRNFWTKTWAHIWFKAYSHIKPQTNRQLITFGPKLNIKQQLRNFFNSKIVLTIKKRHFTISCRPLTFFIHKKKRFRVKRRMRLKWKTFFVGSVTRRSRIRVTHYKLRRLLNISVYKLKFIFAKHRSLLRHVNFKALRRIRKMFKRRRNRRWYGWRLMKKFRKWCFWNLINKKINKLKNTNLRYKRYKFIKSSKFTRITVGSKFFKKSKILKKLLWFKTLKRRSCHFFNFTNYKNLLVKNIPLKYVKPAVVKSVVYALFKKPILTPTHWSNFTLRPTGFLLLTNTLFLNVNNKNHQKVYLIKKKLYSFAYKSQMRKHLLKKASKWRRSAVLVNYFKKRRSLRWKKFYNPVYKELKLSTKITSFTFNSPVSNLRSLLSRRFCSPESVQFTQYIKRKKFGKKRKRLKITVIKFKRLSTWWRRARRALLQSLNIKFRYQHRLTKFIISYKKILNKKFFTIFEMRLLNVLIRTRFTLDQITTLKFIENRLVFVNGVCCSNKDLQIFANDFIQLIVNFKYYITFRWLLNRAIAIKKRIKHFSWKNAQRKRRMGKQWSYRLQRAVLPHKYLLLDIAKYLEVDFFTLSAFVLYDPFLWNDLDRYSILNVRYGVFNLYNWKYIT